MLVKAKRVDNREWVEGTGVTDFINMYNDNKKRDCLWTKNYEWVLIDRKTLCQYTEIQDRNDVRIWERDIVKCQWQSRMGYIQYNLGSYVLREGIEVTNLSDLFLDKWKLEVIGNKIDNPELLEKVK